MPARRLVSDSIERGNTQKLYKKCGSAARQSGKVYKKSGLVARQSGKVYKKSGSAACQSGKVYKEWLSSQGSYIISDFIERGNTQKVYKSVAQQLVSQGRYRKRVARWLGGSAEREGI